MRAQTAIPLLVLAIAAPATAQQQPTLCERDSVPGRHQSPVNIVGAVAARMDSVAIRYPSGSGAVIVNTGNYIRVNVDATPQNALGSTESPSGWRSSISTGRASTR